MAVINLLVNGKRHAAPLKPVQAMKNVGKSPRDDDTPAKAMARSAEPST